MQQWAQSRSAGHQRRLELRERHTNGLRIADREQSLATVRESVFSNGLSSPEISHPGCGTARKKNLRAAEK